MQIWWLFDFNVLDTFLFDADNDLVDDFDGNRWMHLKIMIVTFSLHSTVDLL